MQTPAEPTETVNAGVASVAGSICFFVRAFDGGGAQRDAILLANGLAALGEPASVLTLDSRGPLAELVSPLVPVVDLGQGRKLRMLRAAPALRRFLSSGKPAVFVGSEAGGNSLAILASRLLSGRPGIVLREVASPMQARSSDPYLQNRIGYRLAPLLYPRADLVVVLTKAVGRDLVDHFGVSSARIGWLGTNAVLTPDMQARLDAGARTPEPDLVVAVGRLSPEKDFLTLIDAFAEARQARPALRLEIAGDGPERQALEQRIADRGLAHAVTLLGFQPDVSDLLHRATLFVSSSRYEGYGNAIIEALAAGVPIVSTDAPHGPREILEDGRWGQLVPVGDARALAGAILETLQQRDTPAGASRAAAFTIDAAARRFRELLREHQIVRRGP